MPVYFVTDSYFHMLIRRIAAAILRCRTRKNWFTHWEVVIVLTMHIVGKRYTLSVQEINLQYTIIFPLIQLLHKM